MPPNSSISVLKQPGVVLQIKLIFTVVRSPTVCSGTREALTPDDYAGPQVTLWRSERSTALVQARYNILVNPRFLEDASVLFNLRIVVLKLWLKENLLQYRKLKRVATLSC